jgi:hypothetical protein
MIAQSLCKWNNWRKLISKSKTYKKKLKEPNEVHIKFNFNDHEMILSLKPCKKINDHSFLDL